MEAAVSGTADAWRGRIAAHRVSGQSIRAWCRANGQREHSFYWWRARLGFSPRAGVKRRTHRAAEAVGFAEVVVRRPDAGGAEVAEVSTAGAALSLRLGGGRELILPASLPVEWVARLVRAIGEAT